MSFHLSSSLARVTLALGLVLLNPGSADCSSSFQGKYPAHQVPLSLPSSASAPSRSQPARVAIIGGGPAGTSAAFFISQFANRSGNPIELHLFERSDHLGGRSDIIHPFDSDQYPPVEAGASIFVPANKHLHQAVRQFNLSIANLPKNDGYAIWDGTEFAFESSGRGWWDTLKLFWRYGRGPFQLNSLSKSTVEKFLSVYSNHFVSQGPFEDLSQWARTLDFNHLLATTASDYLINEESVNVQAVNEIAAIMARTNYGQDICAMHGLGALVSIAGSGGASVQGGNRQIFQHFANHSGATLHLSHQVTTITHVKPADHQRSQYLLTYRVSDKVTSKQTTTDSEPFDAVILAAPYHQTAITILSSHSSAHIPRQPFARVHVTFVVTNATAPSGELFNRSPEDLMARSIYSTMMRNVLGKGKRPLFNSLNYLKNLGTKDGVVGEMHIVKIFSEASLSTDRLAKLFGSSQNLLWIKRIEWDAYPILTPLARQSSYAPTKLAERFYYVNGFESIISTMETQTLASWNIAGILSKDFWNFFPQRSWASDPA